MKRFCTEGPVDPKECYYVEREELVKEAIERIKQWRYFTISAPRQTGKTTFLENLTNRIYKSYIVIFLSFELIDSGNEREFVDSIVKKSNLWFEMKKVNMRIEKVRKISEYLDKIREIWKKSKKEIVLIIDEFERLKNSQIINKFLHGIREIYHFKKGYGLRGVIISSVGYLSGIISDSASPFNIADHIEIPYFTKEQVYDLLNQHERESEQRFEEEVKELIWQNTAGQPGLVNALARDLVEKKAKREKIITKKHFAKTLEDFFSYYIDKNITNIITKAKKHEEFVKLVLFSPNKVKFNIYDEKIKELYLNGVIDKGKDGMCEIKVPLYYKALYSFFKPKINGEKRYMKTIKDNSKRYLTEEGRLNLEKLIDRYMEYIKEREASMFKGRKLYEGAYQYNLDAFLTSYVEELGGKVYPEVEIGGGRVDLLVEHRGEEYIIEIKAEPDGDEYEKGKKQLLEYMKRKGKGEGYYIVFSSTIDRNEKIEEEIEGRKIKIWLIKTYYKAPSKVK